MTKCVWKFQIPVDDEPLHLMLPRDAKVVNVGLGYVGSGSIKAFGLMWIEGTFVENQEETWREKIFHIYGTGHPIPHHMGYVGTFYQGQFVWHIYSYGRMI